MTVSNGCTIKCTAEPDCAVCGRRKALRGRSYPMAMGGGYCHSTDCHGYSQDPQAGHLWYSEWHAHERGDHRGCFPDCDRADKPCKACAIVGCQGCDGPDDDNEAGQA